MTRAARAARLAVLAIARGLGLFALARRATRREARILCYHGFAYRDEHRFVPQLFMRPETFRRRLDRIARHGFTWVTLEELVDRLETGTPVDGLVVLTVDDGWTGFRRFAWPEIARRGIPCTLYLTTYYAEKERPVVNVLRRYLEWKGMELPDPLDDSAAEAARLTALAVDAGIDLTCADGSLFRLSPPGDVAAMAAEGLDVQLHTHRHRLPVEPRAFADEVERNRACIERLTRRPARHLCYPSGEHDPAHDPLLAAHGVRSATTTTLGLVRPGADLLRLPRILDGEDLRPVELDAELSGFMTLLRRLLGRPAR